MTREGRRTQILVALTRLLDLIDHDDSHESAIWIRNVNELIKVASDETIPEDDAIENIRHRYKAWYQGGRNFSDYFLWRERFEERRAANEHFNAVKRRLNELLE
jgi:hypothetical protein